MEKNLKDGFKLFQNIAPAYELFYEKQKKYYTQILLQNGELLKQLKIHSILEIGCGTGGFLSVLHEQGYHVTGLEENEELLRVGRDHPENLGIRFHRGTIATKGIRDGSYDLVIAAFKAHDLQSPERLALLREMARVAKTAVLLHDYNHKRQPFGDDMIFDDWESQYRFIHVIGDEMSEVFPKNLVLAAGTKANWYVGLNGSKGTVKG